MSPHRANSTSFRPAEGTPFAHSVTVALHQGEFDDVGRSAHAAGLTRAEWCRMAIRDRLQREEEAAVYLALSTGDGLVYDGAAEALEHKARVLAGYDPGTAEPLTDEERECMLEYADDELGFCATEAIEYAESKEDANLSRWWLGAMRAYCEDKGLL